MKAWSKTWLLPVVLLFASGLMLFQKGYLRFDDRPTRTLEDVEDIAASIPIPFVREAVETAGYEWPSDEKLLRFVVGTKACAGCIIEIGDFGAYVTEEQSIHVAPIALILSDSLPVAQRFAKKVIELAIPAVPSSKPALLDAFGFSGIVAGPATPPVVWKMMATPFGTIGTYLVMVARRDI